MKFVLVDYSRQEDDRGSGKFVQIRNRTTEYLVLGSRETAPYHADLVERFCKEKGLKGSRTADGKRFNIYGAEWVIVGGGKFAVDRAEKSIRLYDDSMAYGKFNPTGMREKILVVDELSGFRVDID